MASEDGPVRRALQFAGMTAGVAGSYLGYLAQGVFLSRDSRQKKLSTTHAKVARRMGDRLAALRGPAMKLGQTLSLQAGLLPEEALTELSRLQMNAPAMHPSLLRAQFKAEMGRFPEEVFRTFEPEPFAAASLGQVHHAVTWEGQPVAVKIQYPGIRQAVKNDFAWFRTVSKPVQLSRYLGADVIDELEEQIMRETDYRQEAANIEHFRKQLKPLAYVTVPEVHPRYSSERVLTMSRIAGLHLDAFLANKPAQRVRDLVGTNLFDLYYFQVLKVGAFHADPHWGNYLFSDDGGIGLVDFGCVKHLAPQFVAHLRRVYLYPGRRDSREFQHLLEERSAVFGKKLAPETTRALMRFAENFYRVVYPPEPDKADAKFDFADAAFIRSYMREAAHLANKRGALPEYLFLSRAETGLYHTLHRLRARVATSVIVRKYLQR
jgi:predicted unusual protein kinase regulating ubiquinone biosynthesis (AarF/ABC1/UbiB family)